MTLNNWNWTNKGVVPWCPLRKARKMQRVPSKSKKPRSFYPIAWKSASECCTWVPRSKRDTTDAKNWIFSPKDVEATKFRFHKHLLWLLSFLFHSRKNPNKSQSSHSPMFQVILTLYDRSRVLWYHEEKHFHPWRVHSHTISSICCTSRERNVVRTREVIKSSVCEVCVSTWKGRWTNVAANQTHSRRDILWERRVPETRNSDGSTQTHHS